MFPEAPFGGFHKKERTSGWMEIEHGKFLIDRGDDGEWRYD